MTFRLEPTKIQKYTRHYHLPSGAKIIATDLVDGKVSLRYRPGDDTPFSPLDIVDPQDADKIVWKAASIDEAYHDDRDAAVQFLAAHREEHQRLLRIAFHAQGAGEQAKAMEAAEAHLRAHYLTHAIAYRHVIPTSMI